MVQRSSDALLMDVLNLLSVEECARGMVQRSNYAAVKGAQIKFRTEESVLSMEQRFHENYAVVKMHKACRLRRSVQEAWSKDQIMQQRGLH